MLRHTLSARHVTATPRLMPPKIRWLSATSVAYATLPGHCEKSWSQHWYANCQRVHALIATRPRQWRNSNTADTRSEDMRRNAAMTFAALINYSAEGVDRLLRSLRSLFELLILDHIRKHNSDVFDVLKVKKKNIFYSPQFLSPTVLSSENVFPHGPLIAGVAFASNKSKSWRTFMPKQPIADVRAHYLNGWETKFDNLIVIWMGSLRDRRLTVDCSVDILRSLSFSERQHANMCVNVSYGGRKWHEQIWSRARARKLSLARHSSAIIRTTPDGVRLRSR